MKGRIQASLETDEASQVAAPLPTTHTDMRDKLGLDTALYGEWAEYPNMCGQTKSSFHYASATSR